MVTKTLVLLLSCAFLGATTENFSTLEYSSNEVYPKQTTPENLFYKSKKTELIDLFDTRENENLTHKISSRILTLEHHINPKNVPPTIKNSTLTDAGKKIVRTILDDFSSSWEDFIVVLVYDSEDVHRDAKIYMEYMLYALSFKVNFLLMKFNSSDVTTVLANASSNEQDYLNLFKWHKNLHEPVSTSMTLTPQHFHGGAVFFAILRAVQILPENSAVVVFTDWQVEDDELNQLALKELLEKRIRLYVIWGGPPPTNNQEKLLKEVTVLSGGTFYVANTERERSAFYNSAYLRNPDATQTQVVIAQYVNIIGSKQFEFPIDSNVRAIHISITSSVVLSAFLISPQGHILNLLNITEVENFSEGSFSTFENNMGRYDIQLNTADYYAPTPTVGLWRFDVDAGGRNAQGCNVTISVQTHLNVTAYITPKFEDHVDEGLKTNDKHVLRVALSGKFTSVDEISVFNLAGTPYNQNVSFTLHGKNKESLSIPESNSNITKQEVDIELNDLPSNSFYLKVLGEDDQGNTFSRLSYFDKEKVNFLTQPLSVEVGLGSELLVMPSQQAKIFFEVTNNRDQVMYVYFMCQDERSLLARMEPRASWLNPKQTVIVTVTTFISNAQSGNYRNMITFTASGPERVQKAAAMQVSTTRIRDNEQPRLWHRYTSDCTDVLLGKCEDSTWALEVTAEDRESGLLQLTSNPKGLAFNEPYIAGTNDRVIGIYGGSCCQPTLQLTAIDMSNNVRTYVVDAYRAPLSAGTISAIVLGILLLLLVIIALIFLCKRKCCKQKQSVDLPTYRSPHGNNEDRTVETTF